MFDDILLELQAANRSVARRAAGLPGCRAAKLSLRRRQSLRPLL
ncbi:hypothetical protein [Roseateles saccharophilus]|nr:hypothetical protein [Roseateles saccharophilus]